MSSVWKIPLILNEESWHSRSQWPRQGVGLQPSACWDRGFDSHRWHGCLSLVQCLCCQVKVSATGRSLVQRSPTDCGVCVCLWSGENKQPRHLLWVGRRGEDYESWYEHTATHSLYQSVFMFNVNCDTTHVLPRIAVRNDLLMLPMQNELVWKQRVLFSFSVWQQLYPWRSVIIYLIHAIFLDAPTGAVESESEFESEGLLGGFGVGGSKNVPTPTPTSV
jgi:hypothetical protein